MLGVINFVLKYWKVLVVVVGCVLCFWSGFYISNRMWEGKYEELKAQYQGCQTSLNGCLAVNEENVAVIEKLREEMRRQAGVCEKRVNEYKKLIEKLQAIDSLKGEIDEKSVDSKCNDDVCSWLNRMWRNEGHN